MPYPEFMIRPMREELTQIGFEELRTSEKVDEVLGSSKGTVMVVVNSVCGCAAGKARPGIALALRNEVRPERLTTVFAGADIDATDTARSYFKGYQPSSPAVALMKQGELVYMLERSQIENKGPQQIAQELTEAFNKYCESGAAVAG